MRCAREKKNVKKCLLFVFRNNNKSHLSLLALSKKSKAAKKYLMTSILRPKAWKKNKTKLEKKKKTLTDYSLHALRDCVHAVCDVSGFLVFLETDGGVATDAEA